MGANKKFTAQQVIDAIPGSGGIVSTIAARLHCKWDTAKSYIDDYATVKLAYDNECEMVTDKAKSVLITSINEGNVQDAKWWLTKKKPDEFGDKQQIEHSGNDGEPLTIRVVYDDGADSTSKETT